MLKELNILIKRFLLFLGLVFGFSSCIEKYDFNVKNENPGVVIEAFIANQSYAQSLLIPADGRYYSVILSQKSDVDNVKDTKISGAHVYLVDSNGNSWDYAEDVFLAGNYFLKDDFFMAMPDIQYQLIIELKEGQHFESNWEAMPTLSNQIGSVSMEEIEKEKFVWELSGRVIKTVDAIKILTNMPNKTGDDKYFYRWTFDPIWMYTAALAFEDSQYITCWVRSDFYLNDYVLHSDKNGNYNQELFHLETSSNERMYQYFSTLINQDLLSEGYYNFWKDLDAQKDKGGLFDQPPFGLTTNFTSTNSDWTVNGYFGVVSRNTQRWEFAPEELSYVIENDLYDQCVLNSWYDPRLDPEQCYDCRYNNQGVSVIQAPDWWE